MAGVMGVVDVFACICAAVVDHVVLSAVDEGADTVHAVGQATRAGTGCGSCHEHLEALIDQREVACPKLVSAYA